MKKIFTELLLVSLGTRDKLTHVPSVDEWESLFDEAQKQAIVGLFKEGIERLPKEQRPPQTILLQWIGSTLHIETTNDLLFHRCVELQQKFKAEGYRSCILKGQGNAMLYPNPYSRTSGDIDIWVDIDPIEAILLSKKIDPSIHYQRHHVDYPLYKDTCVELHVLPTYSNIFVYNRRLRQFFEQKKDKQFANVVNLPDELGPISIPTFDFNCIFQISHMMHHYIEGGIGLRQIVDYYYLLLTQKDEERIDWNRLFKKFGLLKFAKGIMWIEKEYLTLGKEFLLVEPDEKVGRVIFQQIMSGGSWGYYRQKHKFRSNRINYIVTLLNNDIHLFKDFPLEVICQPLMLIWHQWWKLKTRIVLAFRTRCLK